LVKADVQRYVRSQGGYTLVELVIASAIGLFVMTGLTSVVLTTWRAGTVATSRIEASGQVRSFQSSAYEDFALSGVPTLTGCATAAAPPCTISLSGFQVGTPLVPARYAVTYTWDGANVDRLVGGISKHAATNVTAFSASIAGAGLHQTVLVTMTVTVQAYQETQTFLFYPRLNP
jgi:type II secretory pathway pseudopilin PulG